MLHKVLITQKHFPVAYTKSVHPIFALWIIHAPLFLAFLFDFAPFFCLEIHTPRYFRAVASLHVPFLGILQVLRGLLPTSSLYLPTPIEFTRHPWASFCQKSRVASTLLSCQKCPHARLVFTSLVARCDAQFLSPQNLVAHVLSTDIGKCRLLFFSSN